MYEFVRGPMVFISVIIFIIGLIYQACRLISITKKKDKQYFTSKVAKEKNGFLQYFKKKFSFSSIRTRTILGTQPFLALLTFIFHFCIIITPIFLMGHNVLIYQSWEFSFCSFSETITDILTIIFLISALIFLARRILVSRVRAVSSLFDYILLLITIAPFLTGYLTYHQLVNYENIITIHIITGELMLIAVGLTKLGHMIFFFFARFFIGSEYSFRSGSRAW